MIKWKWGRYKLWHTDECGFTFNRFKLVRSSRQIIGAAFKEYFAPITTIIRYFRRNKQ